MNKQKKCRFFFPLPPLSSKKERKKKKKEKEKNEQTRNIRASEKEKNTI